MQIYKKHLYINRPRLNWQQLHLLLKENSAGPSVEACRCRSPVASAPSMWEWGVWVRFLNSIVFLCLICFPSTLPKAVSYVCSLLSSPRELAFSTLCTHEATALCYLVGNLISTEFLAEFSIYYIRWYCYKTFSVFFFITVIVATNVAKIILWRSSVAHM